MLHNGFQEMEDDGDDYIRHHPNTILKVNSEKDREIMETTSIEAICLMHDRVHGE